jgi:hypothetical protein
LQTWERGESVYLWKASGGACTGKGNLAGGPHSLQVSVRGQIVLDTNVEVNDDLSA